MKPFLQLILLLCCYFLLDCNSKVKPVGNIDWPFDIRQNLPDMGATSCDTFLYKTLYIEITHEHIIDTTQFALVIIGNWPIYSGSYKEKLSIDSAPYCQKEVQLQSLKCYLVDKQNHISYSFQAKHAFKLFDNNVRNIKIKLYSSEIEDSGSNMMVSVNNGSWIY